MAILTDSKILECIESKKIIIEPFNPKNLGSNSYDVTLGDKLIVYKNQHLDCKKENETETIEIPEDGILLEPGRLYLGVTREYTETPEHVIIFEGKSSLARLGLFTHITSGLGDLFFCGFFTLELAVVQPLRIYKNMKVGQLYYHTVDGFCINPYNKKEDGKYNNKTSLPLASKMFLNFKENTINREDYKERLKDSGISFNPDDLEE